MNLNNSQCMIPLALLSWNLSWVLTLNTRTWRFTKIHLWTSYDVGLKSCHLAHSSVGGEIESMGGLRAQLEEYCGWRVRGYVRGYSCGLLPVQVIGRLHSSMVPQPRSMQCTTRVTVKLFLHVCQRWVPKKTPGNRGFMHLNWNAENVSCFWQNATYCDSFLLWIHCVTFI